MKNDEYYMKEALKQANIAYKKDEVPIGCIIVKEGKIISRSYNQKTLKNIATYHAEILAINKACKKLNTWYLDNCTLYTTVEPCLMCTGAIIQSRISKVVYGTKNESFGQISKMNHLKIDVKSNVLKEECSSILTKFFKEKRDNN
jgi:tRNA(adenine34) deaminase